MKTENDLGITCPGCDVKITIGNVGGYQSYCEKCVRAMPPIPPDYDKNGKEPIYMSPHQREGGWFLEGRYPNFRWVR